MGLGDPVEKLINNFCSRWFVDHEVMPLRMEVFPHGMLRKKIDIILLL
jgi:hypothetical protein